MSFLGSHPDHQPYGVQKFQWDTEKNELSVAWVNNEVSSPSAVPIISQPTGAVYLIGARDNKWTLESLDWTTGESNFHYVIGGQRYNPMFAGTLLDEDGRIHYGTPWGRVRLEPVLPELETSLVDDVKSMGSAVGEAVESAVEAAAEKAGELLGALK